MEIYLAICDETNEVKMFIGFEDFKDFAKEKRYSHSYFKLGEAEQIYDVDLFYYE